MRAEQYSQTAVMDVRDACALALRRVLEGIDKMIGGQQIKFVRVFDEWPTFDDYQDTPTACVVPPSEWTYDDSGCTPKLMEQTIETAEDAVEGEPPSFGLWKTAEMVDQFMVQLRVATPELRSMFKLAVEDAFQALNLTMNPNEQRYGLLLDLPEYWGLQARASLLSGMNIDDEDQAMRNRRDARFVVSMQATKVQLGAVYPQALTIRKEVQTQAGETISALTITLPTPQRS